MATLKNSKKATPSWFRLAKQQLCMCIMLFEHFFAVIGKFALGLDVFLLFRPMLDTWIVLNHSGN